MTAGHDSIMNMVPVLDTIVVVKVVGVIDMNSIANGKNDLTARAAKNSIDLCSDLRSGKSCNPRNSSVK